MRLMNRHELTTLRTSPFSLFISNEISYAELPDVLKVVNHTHAIFGSIPLVQMLQFITRKTVTTEAVHGSTLRSIFAVLDPAQGAHLRFESVFTSTARACFLISYICTTKAAVHSAGSEQGCMNYIYLCWFYWHYANPERGFT